MAPTSKTDELIGGLQALEPTRNNLLWEVLEESEDTPPFCLYWLLSDPSPLGTHSIGAGFQSVVHSIFFLSHKTKRLSIYIYYRKTYVLLIKCLLKFLQCPDNVQLSFIFISPTSRSDRQRGCNSGIRLGPPSLDVLFCK